MTRKEELKQRAITIVDEFPICFETETEKKEYQEYVFDMLLNVEREVWGKSVKHFETVMMLYGYDNWRARRAIAGCANWCSDQQQELT